jgi:membrane associated rhomboid family serine protease
MSDPAAPAQPPPELGAAEPTPRATLSPALEPTLLQKVRAAPITFALVAINAAVFLWVETHGGTTDEATLLRYGSIEPLHFWVGEYWRVATYMFMHIGWMHILMNMYVLIGWGAALERVLRKKRFLLLYLLSGIGGGCASVAGGILFGPHLSAGASGALFGIIGAVMALRRRQLPSFAAFFADKAIRSTLLQIGLWTAIGSVALHLDNSAHFGGFVVGAAVCWLFTSRSPRNAWLAFAASFAALFVFAARPWWSPTGEHQNDIAIYANSYLTGKNPTKGQSTAWPIDVERGVRFAEKGCSHGVALACAVLADHLDKAGGPAAAAKSDTLRLRTCELDPAYCKPVH